MSDNCDSYSAEEQDNIKASVGLLVFLSLSSVALLVCKILHVINISWLWVLAPLWLTFGLTVGILFLAFCCGLVYTWIKGY